MYDIAIVGAGASGLAAAITVKCTDKAKSVLLIEALPRVGKKILATGNGRCNLTNLNAKAENYNNSFVGDILSVYPPKKILEFFDSIGLKCIFDSEGRAYPMSNTAASVLDCLRFEAENLGVETLCDTHVDSISKKNDSFLINNKIRAEKVILATGGKASPSQGSDGSGYRLLKSLGHNVTPLYPALVQLTVKENVKSVKGVRVKARVKLLQNGRKVDMSVGEILFTDYGLSGIAVMDISRSVKNKNGACILDILPTMSENEIADFIYNCRKRNNEQSAENALCGLLPRKVGQYVLKLCSIHGDTPLKTLSKEKVELFTRNVKHLEFTVTGTNGFNNAQITVGGAELREFNSKTLESKKVKNLFCTGELLDIDSICGGFNLQWAWASGITAGRNAAK